MAMAEAGTAYVVNGNHDWKLARWMAGRDVKLNHGLEDTIAQLQLEDDGFRAAVKRFLEGLPSHVWLDGGRLAVAHAGLMADMIGRGSQAVREFALGHEALLRFVAREPLRRVHECVFGLLALESEPIDPRL